MSSAGVVELDANAIVDILIVLATETTPRRNGIESCSQWITSAERCIDFIEDPAERWTLLKLTPADTEFPPAVVSPPPQTTKIKKK